MTKTLLILWVLSASLSAGEVKPKYGPEAVLLREAPQYVRENAAPDYWALSPYYAAQFNDKACGLASVTMIANGARLDRKLTADDELVTQEGLLKKLKPIWAEAVGEQGHGVPLDRLGGMVQEALAAFGVEGAKVEVVHTKNAGRKTKEKLHQALLENEKSAGDFILINFIQGIYTGDAMVGHIAPIGGYDEKSRRVLVLDPDRRWYEPYWVSEETLLKGMATKDKSSGKNRGYVWVKLP